MNALQRWIARAMPATPQERAAALWSFAYFFMLLASYYVLRPLRDQMGIAGGVKNLPWLFTATFVTLLVAQPLYGALVAKLPRARFIPIVYHFFAANLALFWLLLTLGIETAIVARIFFVWVSVFNLFAVAVFWSFMADLFDAEQGKRLFGFIGAGGTAGALLGPVITIALSVPLGPTNLLIAAIVLLEAGGILRLPAGARGHGASGSAAAEPPRHRRRRLRRAARNVPLALSARRRRLGQPAIVRRDHSSISSRPTSFRARCTAPARRRASSPVSIWRSSLLTLATQVFATGWLLKRFGTGIAAGALPAGLCRGLRRAGRVAEPGRRIDAASRAALDEFRHRQPGPAGVLHRGDARREVQSQEPDRRRDLSRLRRVVRLGVR